MATLENYRHFPTWQPLGIVYDQSADPGKGNGEGEGEGGEGEGKNNAAGGGDSGGSPDKGENAPATVSAEEHQRIVKENAKLKADAEAREQREREAEDKRLKDNKQFETLAETRGAENRTLKATLESERRERAIERATYTADDLKFPIALVQDYALREDAATDHKLEPSELIAKAQDKLEAMGLAPGTTQTANVGGGSPGDRTRGGEDPRIEKLRAAHKRGDAKTVVRLQADLERDGVKIPLLTREE